MHRGKDEMNQRISRTAGCKETDFQVPLSMSHSPWATAGARATTKDSLRHHSTSTEDLSGERWVDALPQPLSWPNHLGYGF
jgi:hypothetical protein